MGQLFQSQIWNLFHTNHSSPDPQFSFHLPLVNTLELFVGPTLLAARQHDLLIHLVGKSFVHFTLCWCWGSFFEALFLTPCQNIILLVLLRLLSGTFVSFLFNIIIRKLWLRRIFARTFLYELINYIFQLFIILLLELFDFLVREHWVYYFNFNTI